MYLSSSDFFSIKKRAILLIEYKILDVNIISDY